MTPSAAAASDDSYTAWQLLRDATYRRPLLIAIVLQLTQQLSGINAVFYYSTSILEESFPDTADVLTVSIGALNVVLTILSVFLMDRAGRRKLLIMCALLCKPQNSRRSRARMACQRRVGHDCLCGAHRHFARKEHCVAADHVHLLVCRVVCDRSRADPVPHRRRDLPHQRGGRRYDDRLAGTCGELTILTLTVSAASIAITFNWACNYAIAQLFPLMSEALGSYSFLPFAVYLMGALVYTLRCASADLCAHSRRTHACWRAFRYVPETKGREVADIVRSLRT